jgi:hypothetical protein
MKRTLLGAPILVLLSCQSSLPSSQTESSHLIPAVAVSDACSAHTTAAACQGDANSSCSWVDVGCPAGASCPAGVCVTSDPCAGLTDQSSCSADARCAWSATAVATSDAPVLCPVGQSCSGGGYCYARGPSPNTCLCVQPLVCPANGACPPVKCDCPPPPPSVDAGNGSGGGGTCTCGCPECPPGAACPACKCDCGGGAGGTGGGGTGGSCGGGSAGPGTCTCNCPACPPGVACPACSCACSAGATTTMTVPSPTSSSTTGTGTASSSGSGTAVVCGCPACPAGTSCPPCGCGAPPPPPADPCAAHTDAGSCAADTSDSCGWVELGIACTSTPCQSGTCIQMKGTPDGGSAGGGGCGCACAACPAGQTCPPCTCNCCPSTTPGTGCTTDADCPQLGIACKLCSDGVTFACPSDTCVNGTCMASVGACP